jgi:hypothetical protein
MGANQREFFRILYRPPDCPIFSCAAGKFNVLDVSETGLRIALKKGHVGFFEQDVLEGQLVFPARRGTYNVKGVVIRIMEREAALQFEAASRIPLAKIMEEQRILIQKGRL